MSEEQTQSAYEPPLMREQQPGSRTERHAMVARAAYFRAEKRGFAPGHELDDWLAAEAEIDRALAAG